MSANPPSTLTFSSFAGIAASLRPPSRTRGIQRVYGAVSAAKVGCGWTPATTVFPSAAPLVLFAHAHSRFPVAKSRATPEAVQRQDPLVLPLDVAHHVVYPVIRERRRGVDL